MGYDLIGVYYMPTLVAIGPYGFRQEDFHYFLVLLPWQPQFLKESNSFKESRQGSWQWVVSEKMLGVKVNTQTD